MFCVQDPNMFGCLSSRLLVLITVGKACVHDGNVCTALVHNVNVCKALVHNVNVLNVCERNCSSLSSSH